MSFLSLCSMPGIFSTIGKFINTENVQETNTGAHVFREKS
jgi:hypothetical protein